MLIVTNTELIVYACPVGPLAIQLDRYFQDSKDLCGANRAHSYMPHCTLTGFFREPATLLNQYLECLDQTYRTYKSEAQPPIIKITGITFQNQWHGLELSSSWLQQLIAKFAAATATFRANDTIRLKDWLHLSLAYDFAPDQAAALKQLAQSLIDPTVPVTWELRFYERQPHNTWVCHHTWPLID